MAMPIKSTPVLKGESASRFMEIIEQNTQKKSISVKETESRKALVNGVLKKAKIW